MATIRLYIKDLKAKGMKFQRSNKTTQKGFQIFVITTGDTIQEVLAESTVSKENFDQCYVSKKADGSMFLSAPDVLEDF